MNTPRILKLKTQNQLQKAKEKHISAASIETGKTKITRKTILTRLKQMLPLSQIGKINPKTKQKPKTRSSRNLKKIKEVKAKVVKNE